MVILTVTVMIADTNCTGLLVLQTVNGTNQSGVKASVMSTAAC